LNTIDEVTGAANRSVPIGRDLRALATTGTSGTLMAIAQASPHDELVRVATGNGTVTVVGATGFAGLQGLTLAGGVFYGWDVTAGLVRIDHLSGLATDVDQNVGTEGAAIQFLTTLSDGRVVGGQDSLYLIDLATGRPQLLGSGVYNDLRGAEERFGVFYPVGQGCAGTTLTLGGEPRPGFSIDSTSGGHRRLAAGFVLLGFSDNRFAGLPLPLPLDALLGTRGCFLYNSADVTFGASASALGEIRATVPIPPFTNGLIFHLQHVALDAAAPGGLEFSNGSTVRIRL
jgi:hypothetical protein